jgi:hypothetical protein
MKFRQFTIVIALAGGLHLSVLGAQIAGTTLPLIPGCLVGAAICGVSGFLFFRAVWKLIH